jgi:hypothetical protein
MGRFTNKIVVITGGTSGIGLAAARHRRDPGRSRQPHRPCFNRSRAPLPFPEGVTVAKVAWRHVPPA